MRWVYRATPDTLLDYLPDRKGRRYALHRAAPVVRGKNHAGKIGARERGRWTGRRLS